MRFRKLCLPFLPLLLICLSCSRPAGHQYDKYRLVPIQEKITVAPFTQPAMPAELIAGTLPETSEKISPETLEELNEDLRHMLVSQSKRQFSFLQKENIPALKYPVSAQTRSLQSWLEYGKSHDLKYLLVPQIINWSERQGSEAGVTSSAEVKLQFYLLDTQNSSIVASSIYEEKQIGLIDNFLKVGDFLKRKGRWVEAKSLAAEGIEQAIKELGL